METHNPQFPQILKEYKMSKEISAPVRALAEDLKSAATLDKTTKVRTFEGTDDIFNKHLPEGHTIEMLKTSQDFLCTVGAAVTLAHGELSQVDMSKDKELDKLGTKVKVGFSVVESSYERKREGKAMGKEWVKYGIANTDITVGVGRKVSDYKAVVAHLGEQAASVFAN